MKTKSTARRATSPKSKSQARQPIKSSWARHSALQDTMKIVLPKDNPYRDGTARYKAYEALRKAKTVGNAFKVDRDYRRALLRSLVHNKVAKVA
jgi:hypothetical protein